MPRTIEAVIFNLETLMPGALGLHRALEKECGGNAGLLRERLGAGAPEVTRGAEERLRGWKSKIELGIFTGLPLKAAGELIKQAGLRDLFQVLVGAEHAGAAWPDAAYCRLAVERVRREPEACLVFEDTIGGVRLARRTGAVVCGMETAGVMESGWRLLREGAAAIANDFDDPAIDRLMAGESLSRIREYWRQLKI